MKPPGRLGDRARHRRVDRDRVGHLVDGEAVLDREGHREDQLGGARGDHHPADHDVAAVAGEELDEPVLHVLHLGPRVGGQRQHHRASLGAGLVHVALGGTDRGDLGVGEDVGADPPQVQRGHRVAERVPHGDPALHRRDGRQGQHAGAVAGRVDAGDGRP